MASAVGDTGGGTGGTTRAAPTGTPASRGQGRGPTLKWKQRTWVARVGIESHTHERPIRVAVIQTLGGGQVDQWGPGIERINISGTTGYGYPWGQPGWESYQALRSFISDYAMAVAENPDPTKETLLYIDPTDNVSCEVVIDEHGLTITRSKSLPMIQQWQFGLIVLRDLMRPNKPRMIVPFLDNVPGSASDASAVAGDIDNARKQPVSSNPDPRVPRHGGQQGDG